MHHLLHQSANPDEAVTAYDAFAKAYCLTTGKNPKFTEKNKNFLRLFGNSSFLSHHLCIHPREFDNYRECRYKDKEKPAAVFASELATRLRGDFPSVIAAIRHYKYSEYVRLTIKELMGLDASTTYREFSRLAQVCVNAYSQFLCRELCTHRGLISPPCDFALIGMGKLGGSELNYSSDIDLIGLYQEDCDHGAISAHEFYSQLFAKLGKDLSHSENGGFVFRVDWDLRPEGKSGTLANSLGAMERYYEAFGATWERQAYIKAAALADHSPLSQEFLALMAPFIYRRSLDDAGVQEILAIRQRRLVEHQRKSANEVNIKLDAGGIRDIEFYVQSLQLLWGGRIPALRQRSTLAVLNTLPKHQLSSPQEAQTLSQAYLFLRRIESCLQMANEAQTHILSSDPKCLEQTARRMYGHQTQAKTGDELWHELARVRAIVLELCFKVNPESQS